MHVILHSLTLIFAIIALKAVWDSHNYHKDDQGELDPLPNLYSIHSWIGILFFIAYILQVCLVFCMIYIFLVFGRLYNFFFPRNDNGFSKILFTISSTIWNDYFHWFFHCCSYGHHRKFSMEKHVVFF